MKKSILSLSIEKQYLNKVSFRKYAFYLHVSTRYCPATSFFYKTKDQKIIRKDMKDSWNSVLDLLVYRKCPIK